MSAPKPRKTRHKTPPSQPTADPRTTKDQSGHPPRKLEFRKPLQSKVFYLDLTGPRKTSQQQKLKVDLEELGGTVETFLTKEVTCVISDRPEVKDTGKGSKVKGPPSGTSPAVSTPSPFHQGRDGMPGTSDSPSNILQDSRVVTRGKAIVQKATKSQMFGTSDVLANARSWSVPIKHLDVVLKYISREKEKFKHTSKDKNKAKKDKRNATAKERHLTKPYLKAEDATRRYRPINKEFTAWPRVLLDTRQGSCPYDPTTRNESHVQEAERTQDRPDASQRTPDARNKEVPTRSQSLSRRVAGKALKRKEATTKTKACKKGFCEYCSVKYTQLERHLQSEQHKQLVCKQNNYFNLDSMIAEGPNLDRFLEDCVRFQSVTMATPTTLERVEEDDNEDEVNLLTESDGSKDCNSERNQEGMISKQNKRSPVTQSRSPTKQSRSPAKHGRSPQKCADRGDRGIRTGLELAEPSHGNNELQNRLSGTETNVPEVGNNRSVEANTNAVPNQKSSNAARSRKRRSGGNKELTCTKTRKASQEDIRDNANLNLASQETDKSRDQCNSGVVLRGIAGDEEHMVGEGCSQEVMIIRVRRDEINRTEPDETERSRVQPLQEHSEQCDTGLVLSTGVASPSRKDDHQNRSVEEAGEDSVFDDDGVSASNKNASTISNHASKEKETEVRSESKKLTGRHKRKSRRSHGDAPPRKVRGNSIAVDSALEKEGQKTAASPCLREPLPSRLPVLNTTHSSDDFEPVKSPAHPHVNRPLRRGKRTSDEPGKLSITQGSLSGGRRVSPRKRAIVCQTAAADSTNSEQDFQLDISSTRSQSGSNAPGRSKRKTKQLSKEMGKQCNQDSNAQDKKTSTNEIVCQEMEGEKEEGIMECSGNNKSGQFECDSVKRIQDPKTTECVGNSIQAAVLNVTNRNEQSLELVFRSDLGVEESDFLGFSAEEIEEAENQSQSFKQNQVREQNLEAAALNVYCLPSSDLCPDDDKSSNGSFGDFTIGLVLQKVDNFPSEGSEWEEQVTGYMKKLDTELEIKKRRESEISTLPSPNFMHLQFGNQKENQSAFPTVLEDFAPELVSQEDIDDDPVFETGRTEAENGNNVENVMFPAAQNIPCLDDNTASSQTLNRRQSARLRGLRPVTRSSVANQISYSGMCSSPSKKRRSTSAGESIQKTGHKQALRELSSNQVPQSFEQIVGPDQCSTPKKGRPTLVSSPTENRNSSHHIVFPPGTSMEEQQEILENYVHDDSESEVVFPKFSSPVQAGSVFSPVKQFVKNRPKLLHRRRQSAPPLGHRDVQSSPIRPSNRDVCLPFGLPSSRRSLFIKGRVKHIHISSPNKQFKHVLRSPRKLRRRSSVSSPTKRSPPILSFLNELRTGLSPTFYTFKKPHFSLRILQPSAVRGPRYRTRMSRSLFALNLCLPSEEELRIYEFHDDSSMEEEEEGISPTPASKKQFTDKCTQTPPSHKKGKTKPRRLSLNQKQRPGGVSNVKETKVPNKGESRNFKEVTHDNENSGMRNMEVQTSSPDIETIMDMPLDYYL